MDEYYDPLFHLEQNFPIPQGSATLSIAKCPWKEHVSGIWNKSVWDVTWMSDQSVHLAKWLLALEQVTAWHLVKCPHQLTTWPSAIQDLNLTCKNQQSVSNSQFFGAELGQVAQSGTQLSDSPHCYMSATFWRLTKRLPRLIILSCIREMGSPIKTASLTHTALQTNPLAHKVDYFMYADIWKQ